MKKTLINILKIVLPLGIGVYLTWFFISNMSEEELTSLKEAFIKADYIYLFYGLIIMLLSHMSRAYRWKYMLEPLGHKPNFWKMYHSVMIGYLINLTIPRSGEVARAGYYAKFQENTKFDKVFGTIIVERIIDLVMLSIVLGITLYLQKDLEAFNEIRNSGKTETVIPMWVYFTAAGAILVGIVAILKIPILKEKVLGLIKGVLEGVKTIFKLKQRAAYILHTLFIWGCYVGMIWVCAFALPETAGLSMNAVFAAFVVGAVAISASPGGLGLYPFMVATLLSQLYGIENAGSFSMLAWSALTLFTILAGLVSLFVLPFTNKKQIA
ncbi:MAG: lysylphosphatidylglycerol synthase transmembrane domain-containing protein [Vicingaceae bacterium]|nr:lysylphosphatidylglycerol synthase transmembrane domain-containing protein [Vicingaceae bacterium]